jgi:transmembrane sensor
MPMTDTQNPFQKGQLRLEATEWFVLMRGPDAEQHRAAFEHWLARGALHRAAYNRVANLYSAGKQVDWEGLPDPKPVRARLRRTKVAALACLTVVGFFSWRLLLAPAAIPDIPAARTAMSSLVPAAAYRTQVGEIRQVQLADGSDITLDGGTLLLVAFGTDRRSLRLEQGRARFSVAHETRPFVVSAGGSDVVARGTIFDVSFDRAGTTQVQLLRGAVDVQSRSSDRASPPVRLKPGQKVQYDDGTPPGLPLPVDPADVVWAMRQLDFHSERLARVVELANQFSDTRIVLSDPALGALRVSGVFRVDDPGKLARSLAMVLGLTVRQTNGQLELVTKTK